MDKEKTVHQKEPVNGSMANNLDEVKALGKQMEEMDTNQELEEQGLQPDPAQ